MIRHSLCKCRIHNKKDHKWINHRSSNSSHNSSSKYPLWNVNLIVSAVTSSEITTTAWATQLVYLGLGNLNSQMLLLLLQANLTLLRILASWIILISLAQTSIIALLQQLQIPITIQVLVRLLLVLLSQEIIPILLIHWIALPF